MMGKAAIRMILRWTHDNPPLGKDISCFSLEDGNFFNGQFLGFSDMCTLYIQEGNIQWIKNKAENTATPVACGRAGAIFEVSGAFGQERYSQKPHKRRKSKV